MKGPFMSENTSNRINIDVNRELVKEDIFGILDRLDKKHPNKNPNRVSSVVEKQVKRIANRTDKKLRQLGLFDYN